MLQAREGVLLYTEFIILNKKSQKVVKYGLVFVYK